MHKLDKIPIIASMCEESTLRLQKWLKQGCNAFEGKTPASKPMSFWTENDVLQYIKENNLKIAEPYGEVVQEDPTMLDGFEECKYKTTGCVRTGCMYCGFGVHLEKESRFLKLKKSHPKVYDYCIGGGMHNEDGIWIPSNDGLGLGHVFDKLNELYSTPYKKFIDY